MVLFGKGVFVASKTLAIGICSAIINFTDGAVGCKQINESIVFVILLMKIVYVLIRNFVISK